MKCVWRKNLYCLSVEFGLDLNSLVSNLLLISDKTSEFCNYIKVQTTGYRYKITNRNN